MQKRSLLCLGLLLLLATPAAGQTTDSTYRRAEAFVPWNVPDLTSNTSVNPHWIDDGSRFWYRRETPNGHEFIFVDPDENVRRSLFDHQRMARAISQAAGMTFTAERLPFQSVALDPEASVLRFDLEGRGWECSIPEAACTELRRPWDVPGESRSPDAKWSAFVDDHDLFVRSEGTGDTVRLTHDGTPHHGYASPTEDNPGTVPMRRHGIRPEPVVAWGPEAERLLTSRVDERAVGDIHLLQTVPAKDSYPPQVYSYRSARPGDSDLPAASLYVMNFEQGTVTPIRSDPLLLTAPYSPIRSDAWWSNDGDEIYLLDYGRGRKSVALRAAKAATGETRTLLTERRDVRIDLNPMPFGQPNVTVLADGDEVIWFSDRDGWGQLYLYDGRTGELENRITDGSFVVRDIEFVDTQNRTIYFSATGVEDDRDPYLRQLYRAPLDGGGLTRVTPEDADHSVEFSPDGRYFVDTYFWGGEREHPTTVLRSADGEMIRTLERGSLDDLEATGAELPERFSVKAADSETDLYGFLFRPSDFRPDEDYPIVEWVYPYPQTFWASPGISMFGDPLDHFLEAQAVAELGFVVVMLDGRGTPGRSAAFHDASYGRLMSGRMQDHVAALRQLGKRHSFIDLDRVGVYGHSGGGEGTVRAMLEHPDFYEVGVASAGTQDPAGFRATIMEQLQGYPMSAERRDAQANWRLAEELEGDLLLAHGELDGVVHPAHTMRLVDALIDANRDFDLLLMPNTGHGLNESPYFIRQRWDYFVEHLLPGDPPEEYRLEREDRE